MILNHEQQKLKSIPVQSHFRFRAFWCQKADCLYFILRCYKEDLLKNSNNYWNVCKNFPMAIIYFFNFAITFLHADFLEHNLLPFGLELLLDDGKYKIKLESILLRFFIDVITFCWLAYYCYCWFSYQREVVVHLYSFLLIFIFGITDFD